MQLVFMLRGVMEEYLVVILGYFYFSIETYIVGTHWKCLTEALLMSTHICFFMENWTKLSQNYHQILLNNPSDTKLDKKSIDIILKLISKQVCVLIRNALVKHC